MASIFQEIISVKSTVEEVESQMWSLETTVDSIESKVAELDRGGDA